MRIMVMGAGGIGSYLGGMLARSGADVTLVCRGAHLAAINRSGLSVKSPGREFSVQVKAAQAPVPADVTLLGVKLYDLEHAARALPPGGLVITLQNGVTAADEVGAIVGAGRVAAGAVFLNARLTAPGEVTSRSEINTVVFDERARPLIDLCVAAGVDAHGSTDIRAELWRKFVPVAALSALSSLSRRPIGPVREDPQLRKLYRQAMQEVADLAKAKGIALEADIVERTLALAERYKYDARVSMLEDLEAGRPLEVEWLSGYVSREAARLGVPAPFHDLAYACLKFVNDKTPQRPR
jgi:2-dehydropantoate 2-reductase